MPLQLIKSQKGYDLLTYEGYIFRKEREHKEKIIWKCCEYRTHGCRGRVHTSADTVLHSTEHNHVPNPGRLEAKQVVSVIRNRAGQTEEPTQQIVAAGTVELSLAAKGQLPQISTLKRMVQRVRQREGGFLPTPSSLLALVIPEEYKTTFTGANFLLYDSGAEEERILIFSTARNLEMLAQGLHWYGDGTFKTVPPLFGQLYTIHGIKDNSSIPAIFALLPNKIERTYLRFFTALKELNPNLQPQSMMTDFEVAALKAFAEAFPTCVQRGCFFHLCQCLWRHIQGNQAIRERYIHEADFALSVRMLAALAFVPVDDVTGAFERLLDSPFYQEHEQVLQPLTDYFEDTWLGRPDRRGRRRGPVFPLTLWNCYDAVSLGLAKTNNAVEGWHRGFSELVGACHPNIWKFINCLKQEQSLNETRIEMHLAGNNGAAQRRKYRDCAQRIQTIVADYGNRPLIDYLRGLAHNYNMQV